MHCSLILCPFPLQENIFKLFEEAGLKVNLGNARGYRPTIPLKNYDVKLLKVRSRSRRRRGGEEEE